MLNITARSLLRGPGNNFNEGIARKANKLAKEYTTKRSDITTTCTELKRKKTKRHLAPFPWCEAGASWRERTVGSATLKSPLGHDWGGVILPGHDVGGTGGGWLCFVDYRRARS